MNPSQAAPPAQATADPSQFGEYSDWAKQEMAKGFSPDQLHATLGQQGGADPQPKGNWFTHLLPTIGGVGGSILGGLATAGLGGEVVGGAGGSAAGKALENALEGKNALDQSDLTAGVEGGLGSLGGGLIGKGLGKAAGALSSRAGNITKTAADAVEQKTAQNAEIAAAKATQNNYGSISGRLQGDLKLGTHQNFIKGMGYDHTDPYAMQQASQAGLHLNNVYDGALQNAAPVDMKDFGNTVYQTMQKSGTTDLSTTPLGKALSKYGLKPNETLPESMPATDVRKLQQAVGEQIGGQQRLINNAINNGMPATEAEGHLTSLQDIYGQLGSKLKTPQVDATITKSVTTPEQRAALVDQFGETHGNHIADTIDNAKKADDLLKPMQSYKQMDSLSKMAKNDIENATATGRAVARAKGDITGDGVADSNAPLEPSNADILPAMMSTSNPIMAAVKGAVHAKDNPRILETLSRIGNMGAKLAPAAGTVVATSPNLAADPVASTAAGGTMGGIMQNGNATVNGGVDPNSQQELINAMRAQSILAPFMAGQSGATNFMQAMSPQLQKNDAVGNLLAGLPAGYANAGGAQGTGGILSHISGLIPGTAAHTYQAQQGAAAHQLGQALGISPEAAAGLMPQLMQNGQTAGISQGILGSLQGQLAY